MAVVLGTSSGFVTVAPTADPNGSGVTIDGSSVVTKDTAPATAIRITEIGWYRASGTNSANYEVALYAEAAGIAATRLFVDATNSDTGGGWVRVPVSWNITAGTAYWLGLQMDAHSSSSTVDSAASGGSGSDVLTSQTTLASPYGGGVVADADGMYSIYALWVPAPAGAATQAFTLGSTTAGTVTERARATGVARISLAAGTTPTVRTDHVIHVKARTTTGSTGKVNAALYEGASNRSGDLVQSDTLSTTLTDVPLAISEANATNITSYADLEIRLWGTNATGGLLVYEVAEVSLSIPEGAAGPTEWFGAATQALTLTSTAAGSHSAAGVTTQTLAATFTTQGFATKAGRNLDGTTNQVANGGFETNANGWSTHGGGAGATIARDTAEHQYGVASGKVTPSGGALYQGAQYNVAATPGETWTGSLYLKASAPKQMLLQLWYLDSGFGFLSNSYVPFTSTTGWVRYQITAVVPAGAAAYVAIAVETNEDTTDPWWIDGVQLERQAAAHPYVETDGAVASSHSFDATFTTQGARAVSGAVVDALTATFTTTGTHPSAGAVVDALTATFTTQGTVTAGAEEVFGAASSDYAAAFTTTGTHPSAGVVSDALTGTFTTTGLGTHSGVVSDTLASTFTTQGLGTHAGVVSGALTATFTTTGTHASAGVSTENFTSTFTTQGTHPAAGVVSDALTATFTTQGTTQGAQSGSVTTAFTSTSTTVGKVEAKGAVSLDFKPWVDGTAITSAQLSDSNYTDIVEAYFGSVTPEWEMQWGQIEPTQGNFNWTQVDAIRTYANAHGLEMRGHCLIWDAAGNTDLMPTWVTGGSWTRTTLLAALENHITQVVNRYKDKVRVWNCVNEAFEDNGSRTSWVFQTVIGDDWIEKAFEYAHAADPTAILLYNDYGIDWGYFGGNPKYDAVLAMLTDFVGRGIPVHGVGTQGHYDLQYASYPHPADYPAVLQTYRDLGLLAEVTELDCRTDNVGGSTQDKLQLQAGVYELARKGLQQVNGDHVTVWGLSDATNWLGSGAAAAPFDASYVEKPAWVKIKPGGAAIFTTQGIRTVSGATSQTFAATLTTVGTHPSTGVATEGFAATFTTQGTKAGAAGGSVTDDFTATFTTTGRVDAHAAAIQALTGTFTTQGYATRSGATTQSFATTFTTLGFRTSSGVVISPLAGTFTTRGLIDAHGAVSAPFAASFTTVGTHPSAATVVAPFTATFTTQGFQQGQQFGASSAVFAATFTTAGKLDAHAAVIAPFAATFATRGFRTSAGVVVLPLAATFTTQGSASHETFGSVVAAFTYTSTTSGKSDHSGQSVVTLALTAMTVGQVGARGVVVLPLTGAYTTAGTLSAFGVSIIPLTLDTTTRGAREFFGESVRPFVLGITTTPATLVLMAPIWTGHIAYGRTGEAAEEARARGRIATNGAAHIEQAEEGLVAV